MAKLLLVDDEHIVRVMLKTIVDWKHYGIKEVIEASCASEALEIMKQGPADVLFSDIRMPGVSGLDLLKTVRESCPGTICVVMTAYDEFDYVRNAFRIGAFDFIIKDEISSELLCNLMSKIQGQLKKGVPSESKETDMKIRRESLLLEYLCGNIDEALFKSYLEKFKMKKVFKNILVFYFKLDNLLEIKEIYKKEQYYIFEKLFLNVCDSFLGNYYNVNIFPVSEHYYAVIESYDSCVGYKHILESTFELIRRLKEIILSTFNTTLTVGVSEIGSNIKELCRQAHQSLEYYFIRGKDSIIHYKDIASFAANTSGLHLEIEEFKRILEIRDREKTHEYIKELSKMIKNSSVQSIQEVYSVFIHLLFILNGYLNNMGLNFKDIFKVNVDFYEKIGRYNTVDEIALWFKNMLDWIDEFVRGNDKLDYRIKKVIQFIQKHYHEDISLNTMADIVNITPNYLSKLFDKEMGTSFTEYLVQFRISKAKDMLMSSDYSINEISEMIGYPNLQHFYKMFKKITGKSPNEYRKLQKG